MSCEPGSDLDWRPAGADDGCILSCVNHLLPKRHKSVFFVVVFLIVMVVHICNLLLFDFSLTYLFICLIFKQTTLSNVSSSSGTKTGNE